MKIKIIFLVATVFLPTLLASQSINVPSTSNIYGAGHNIPPGPAGGGNGTLPVEITIPPNTKFIAFPLVTGQVSCCNGDNLNNPDGNPGNGTVLILDAFNGLSGLELGAFTFLAGVFLNDDTPSAESPPTIDYSGGTAETEYRPLLNQIFFIGDGATGNKEGAIQKFFIPEGATRLFLGIPDTYNSQFPGYYGDNTGFFEVRYLLVKDLDFEVRKNNCEGTGEIYLVNITESFGVNTTFDWWLNEVLLSSGKNSGLTINEPGTYTVTQTFSFQYTDEILECSDSVKVDLPHQSVSYEIQTKPANCYSNDGVAEIITLNEFDIRIEIDNQSAIHSPIITNLFPGQHVLKLIFEDVCETFETISIGNEKCDIYIPNAISPNEDGINDQFRLFTSEHNNANIEYIEIFDKWGNKIFYEKNLAINDFRFDIKSIGKNYEQTSFVFQAKIVHEDQQTEMIVGEFTIIN